MTNDDSGNSTIIIPEDSLMLILDLIDEVKSKEGGAFGTLPACSIMITTHIDNSQTITLQTLKNKYVRLS